jgi:drug/metabolite transporter (DMT)-like permease
MATHLRQTFNQQSLKVLLAFTAIYVIWGTTYLAIRLAIDTIPPFFMAGTRFLLAGIIAFTFLLMRGVPFPRRMHWRSAIIIGLFLLVGGNGFVTWSEQQVPSGIAALVVATVPLWMAVFDWLIFKGSRPGRKVTAGVILGLLGIGLLIGPGQFSGPANIALIYLLILFLAPILWSLGSLYSRKATLPENAFMSTAMEMIAGGVALFVVGFLTGEFAHLQVADISSRSIISTLYLTLFGSIIALTAYSWLLKNVPAAKVATYTYVNPIIAVFLGWFILGESLTPLMLLAIVVIVMAVFLINSHRHKEETILDDNLSPSSTLPKSSPEMIPAGD